MAPSTGKNVILSLLLSLTLTVIGAFLYYFYPILAVLVANAFDDSHTGFVVAGGGSGSLLPLLLIASALFIVIFLLLQKRSAKGKVS